MTYEQLIAKFRTQARAAEAIGVTKGAVSHWKKAGYIPYLRQLQIQKVTRGRLKADEVAK